MEYISEFRPGVAICERTFERRTTGEEPQRTRAFAVVGYFPP